MVWLTPDPPGDPMPPEADEQREILDDGIWAVAEASRIDGYAGVFDARGYDTGPRVTHYDAFRAAKVFEVISY